MFNFLYDFIFTIASLYILINAVSYSIYEIKSENNKQGGITVFVFSLLVTLFVNFIIWLR